MDEEDPQNDENKEMLRQKEGILNWRREYMISIFDCYNSPMRKLMLNHYNKKSKK